MLEDILSSGLDQLGVEYHEGALPKLRRYYEMLKETNKVMNLTAISGEENVARLHFLDCAAVLRETDISEKTLYDIGTGAGFPGLVLKILRPDAKVVLIDSLDKRIGFLKNVCDELGLDNTACIHARAEEAAADYREKADVVVSRAVAGLNVLSELALPFAKKDGHFIAMKGPDYEHELDEAKNAIRELGGKTERCVTYGIPGTEISHSLIIIRKLSETHKRYPRRWAQIKKAPL